MTIAGAVYRDGVAYIDGALCVKPVGTAAITGGTVGLDDGAVGTPSLYRAATITTGFYFPSSTTLDWVTNSTSRIRFSAGSISTSDFIGMGATTGAPDAVMLRTGANSVQYSASVTAAAATGRTEVQKAVTAFTNAAAKAVFTITIPNAAHSASIMVRVTGSLGAGGAIGANEATATNCYVISLTRTAGVNATAAISAAFGAAATAVAGAATVTCTAAMSAVSGAVGASNSFTVDVTISRSGGTSDNHTCVAHASLLNANSTGITIA